RGPTGEVGRGEGQRMTDAIVILVTAGSDEEAKRIGAALVERRLAACVNLVGPIRSIYRWDGEVRDDPEVLLVVKTTRERFAAVEQAVREMHSYDAPEVVAVGVEQGSLPYLDWIAGS